MSIPFNKPSVEGRELDLVRQAIAKGHISGACEFTRRAKSMLESILGAVPRRRAISGEIGD